MLIIFAKPRCFKSINRDILYVLPGLKIVEVLEENIRLGFAGRVLVLSVHQDQGRSSIMKDLKSVAMTINYQII